jgi:hypothetical protein
MSYILILTAKWLLYCHVYESPHMGFGLVIGFTDHLQIVTTSNYSSVANSRSAVWYSRHLIFSVCCVFTGILVAASNGGCSLYSGFANYPHASVSNSNSNSSQGLNRSSSLSLTHQPLAPLHSTPLHSTPLHCTAPRCTNWTQLGRSSDIASEWTTQKTPPPMVLALLHPGHCLAVLVTSVISLAFLPSD